MRSADVAEVFDPSDPEDRQQLLRDDSEAMLRAMADSTQFPLLSAALAGPHGAELRHELAHLVLPQLRLRAHRRLVRVLCRLEAPGYNEPVLLTDISTTGVRFLVLAEVPLDLSGFAGMLLHVKSSLGPRALPITLVRLCGGDGRHTDVACRFSTVTAEHAQVIAQIHSQVFDEGAKQLELTKPPRPRLARPA